MIQRTKIRLPIIVEGRYDKSTLSSIFDATIVATDGFSVFNSAEKRALIKKLAERGGVILLTDSDAGGRQIRSFLTGLLPKDKIFHLYIPEVAGKERRKKAPSKAGLLGVEGMSREILEKVLSPFIESGECLNNGRLANAKMLTKLDFFNDGLSGGEGSAEKRDLLAMRLGLPSGMSSKALIEAINLAVGYEEYRRAYKEEFGEP